MNTCYNVVENEVWNLKSVYSKARGLDWSEKSFSLAFALVSVCRVNITNKELYYEVVK